MHCLFCKCESNNSKTKEHIVPESLGNTKNILPVGYVCDKCNNYFSIKVEKPFFELGEIKALRFQECIPNKSGRYQVIEGILNDHTEVKLTRIGSDREISTSVLCESDDTIEELRQRKKGRIIFPAFLDQSKFESSTVVSRFIAKIALEAFVQRLNSVEALDYLVNHNGLDPIREHARFGRTPNWPCSIRRVYSIQSHFRDSTIQDSQILYEYDFLVINTGTNIEADKEVVSMIVFFVIAIFGLEFVINIVEPSIDGYYQWLNEHKGVSPLYFGKNEIYPKPD